MKRKRSYKELVSDIGEQIGYTEDDGDLTLIGTHSHNIIRCILQEIDARFGQTKVIAAMTEWELDLLGWTIPEVKS